MTKFIEYIIALFSQFTPAKQVFLVLIAGGLMFLGYNFVKNETFRKSIFKLGLVSLRSLKFNSISLLNHELFYKQHLFNQLISNVKFSSEIKTKLFRILLEEKSKSIILLSKEWVKTLNLKDITDVELFDKMTCLVIDIINDYERNIKLKYKELIGSEWLKIWNLVYESKNGFKEHHADNVNYIQRNINRIAFTKAFSTKQKIYSFITQLEIAAEMAITDCEKSFELLNGNLEKLILKNEN